MEIGVGTLIAGAGFIATLGGSIFAGGVFLGSFRSKFMSRNECVESKKTCQMGHINRMEETEKEVDKIEKKIDSDIKAHEIKVDSLLKDHEHKTDEKIRIMDERHERSIEVLFEKVNQIFDGMEDIKLNIVRLETTLIVEGK